MREKLHRNFPWYGKLFLKLFLVGILFYFLTATAQIKFQLFAGFFHQPFQFSFTILMFILMILMSAQRWHLLNQAQNIHIGFIRTITPTYLGVAFNNLLPGAIGGDVVRSYYLFKKEPNKKSTLLLSILLDRVFGFLGVLVAICGVAIFHMHQLREQPKLFSLLLIFVFFCLTAIILFLGVMLLPRRFALAKWLNNRFGHKSFIKPVVSLLEAIKHYKAPKIVMLNCLLFSVGIQIIVAFTASIIAKMMGFPFIEFNDYLIAMGITQIVNLIPMTPGGIGIGEIAFANILLLLNPSVNAPFATIFLGYRLIGMLSYLPGVLYYTPQLLMMRQKKVLSG